MVLFKNQDQTCRYCVDVVEFIKKFKHQKKPQKKPDLEFLEEVDRVFPISHKLPASLSLVPFCVGKGRKRRKQLKKGRFFPFSSLKQKTVDIWSGLEKSQASADIVHD